MIPASFEYVAPSTVDDAIGLLQRHGDDAKVLAGGHSLLPLMKLRLAMPSVVVDLRLIPDLRYVRDLGDQIAIGAMARYVDLQHSDLLRQRVPMLPHAISDVGDAQVRNRGTLGGALAHADPAGDMPTVALALGGSVIAHGSAGKREIPLDTFFADYFTSALEPDEILTEIRINAPPNRVQCYETFRGRAADWAVVGVAVNVGLTRGTTSDARIVLSNVGPKPMVAVATAALMDGQAASDAIIATASERAADGLEPTEELNASPAYKRHLARVLTRRALTRALLS